MIPIYKTFIKIKNSTIDIQKKLIKDYHSLEHQQTRLKGSYNFKLSLKYNSLIVELSEKFIDQINIPITEDDIEMFKHLVNRGESFSWTFRTEDSEELIEINFVQEEED